MDRQIDGYRNALRDIKALSVVGRLIEIQVLRYLDRQISKYLYNQEGKQI